MVIEEARSLRPAESAAHFVVDDVAATMRELRGRGVEFDEFDLPELQTTDGVATVGDAIAAGSATRTTTFWRSTTERYDGAATPSRSRTVAAISAGPGSQASSSVGL